MDEKVLINRAKEGDMESFEMLARSYQNRIYYLSLRILKNEQDAFDASQEALIKIYRSISRFEFRSAFSTWVHTITKNACLDFIRKNSAFTYTEDIYQLPMETIGQSGEGNPETRYENKEDGQRLAAFVNTLPGEQRKILILRDMEGYRYEEIAELLHLPVGTVKSRLNRARKKLSAMIRPGDA